MKRLLLAVTAFVLVLSANVNAQKRHCAAQEIHEHKMVTDAKYAAKQAAIEGATRRYLANPTQRVSGSQIIIPCIVHVVYANSQENISDAQVQSQIDRLNADFAATNADYNNTPSEFASFRSGDTDIRFELIETKRYADSRSTWGTNDAVKSAYPPIEPDRILNMWVADIGGGILGYAQFPGGNPNTDGVVMSPQYFGDATAAGGGSFYLSAPFNRGRTATHEVGHWLNLRHIWGDGNCNADDFVNDTPTAGNPNYGCPSAGTNSCSGGLNDMFMNYMDYVDDACMFMFTAGQDARMQATFSNGGGREGFLLDPVYTPGSGGGGDPTPPTCGDGAVTLTLVTDNYGSETSWTVKNASGSTLFSGSGYGNNQTITETFNLADGDYTFTINDSYGDGICCSYGNGSYSLADAGNTVLASGGSFASSETKSFCVEGGSTGGGGGGGGGGNATIFEDYFESGWGNWNDGGSDCFRYSGANSYEGSFSIRIRDNSGNASSMTSDAFDASSFDAVEVEFYFYPNSMENGEDFLLEYSNGGSWTTVASWARGTNFNNGTFYTATESITGLGSNARIRFRCDASGNNDQIYIDQVTVRGVSSAKLAKNSFKALRSGITSGDEEIKDEMTLYPNPTAGILNIQMDEMDGTAVEIYNINGQLVRKAQLSETKRSVNVADLKAGVYIVKAINVEGTYTQRFIKK